MDRTNFLKPTGLLTLGALLMNDLKSLANTFTQWEDTETITPFFVCGTLRTFICTWSK